MDFIIQNVYRSVDTPHLENSFYLQEAAEDFDPHGGKIDFDHTFTNPKNSLESISSLCSSRGKISKF